MSTSFSGMYRVLLVEDNPADARLVRERLHVASDSSTFQLTHVLTLREALTCIQQSDFQAILLDLNLPECNGLETVKRVRSVTPTVPIVVLTVTDDEPMALASIKLGAQDFLPKSQLNSILLTRVLSYAIEREKIELTRRESERKYRLFVEGATGLAFILLDLEGKIIHWNSGAQRLFGYTENFALNKYFSFLFPADDQKHGRPETEIRNAISEEKGEDENWLTRADGTRFWASGALTAVKNAGGSLIGFAKVVRDNTAKKEANDKLAELNRTLEDRVNTRTKELVRNQERLRAMASDLTLTEQRERRRLASDLHDYLAQLLVACRLKLSQHQSIDDPESMRSIMQEADGLLDESLTYTRTLVTQLSPTCLYEFGLHAALVWLGSEMKKQGLTVNVNGETLIPDLPEDQAVLIYQSVRELLFNVLKHSGVKESTLTLSLHTDNYLHILVEDRGRGFIEHSQSRDEHSSTKFGLFSIRERLEALDGEIMITSIPQDGTQVLLRVPLKQGAGPIQPRLQSTEPIPPQSKINRPRPRSGKIRILLVDDHKMVREGFCRILSSQIDMEVVGEAENGQQAITFCQSIRPDVVVMDLHMPTMDGLEATRRIKQEFPDIVVIGISVYDNPDVARLFLEAHASEFIPKGGSAESLMYAIRQFGHQIKIKRT